MIGSDGSFAEDAQPLSRMSVFCIAKSEASGSARGSAGGGGRVALDYFQGEASPEHFAKEAARQAIIQLDAREAPAGEMEVVLGPGWPGILLHEAIGHGLEADFNRKKTSAFSGMLGQRVASDKCTVVDNGTMPGRRGSLNVDDEGNPTDEHRADREGHSEGLSRRQAVVAPDGHSEHRQRPSRELSAHSHAAHDEHLHARGPGFAGRHHQAR